MYTGFDGASEGLVVALFVPLVLFFLAGLNWAGFLRRRKTFDGHWARNHPHGTKNGKNAVIHLESPERNHGKENDEEKAGNNEENSHSRLLDRDCLHLHSEFGC